MRRNRSLSGRNPNDREHTLFKKLTRLLSAPLLNRRSQYYRHLRRKELEKYGRKFTSASGKEFKKHQYNPFEHVYSDLYQNYNRSERYAEFESMEFDPDICSTLDIVSDEMTTWSTLRPMLNITHPNDEIKIILENLYFQILNVEYNLFRLVSFDVKVWRFFLIFGYRRNFGD